MAKVFIDKFWNELRDRCHRHPAFLRTAMHNSRTPGRQSRSDGISPVILPFIPAWHNAGIGGKLAGVYAQFKSTLAANGISIPRPAVAWALGGKHLVRIFTEMQTLREA